MAHRYNDWERSRRLYREEGGYGLDLDREYDYGRDRYGWRNDYAEPWWRDYPETPPYREYTPWMRPGPYTGRGPRGYQRLDERICEEVCERLTRHGQLDASDIEVSVNNGEVTLEGRVDSRWDKRLAEDAADSVSGVTDVHNQLRVSEFGQSQGTRDTTMKGQLIRTGMAVVGADGERIGEVKETRSNDFLVNRPMARDIYVPFSACRTVSGMRVVLNIRADEVDHQGWPIPELVETPSQY